LKVSEFFFKKNQNVSECEKSLYGMGIKGRRKWVLLNISDQGTPRLMKLNFVFYYICKYKDWWSVFQTNRSKSYGRKSM